MERKERENPRAEPPFLDTPTKRKHREGSPFLRVSDSRLSSHSLLSPTTFLRQGPRLDVGRLCKRCSASCK